MPRLARGDVRRGLGPPTPDPSRHRPPGAGLRAQLPVPSLPIDVVAGPQHVRETIENRGALVSGTDIDVDVVTDVLIGRCDAAANNITTSRTTHLSAITSTDGVNIGRTNTALQNVAQEVLKRYVDEALAILENLKASIREGITSYQDSDAAGFNLVANAGGDLSGGGGVTGGGTYQALTTPRS